MKYIYTLLAVLLVVASLAVLPIADEGGDGGDAYGELPAVENGKVILADEGEMEEASTVSLLQWRIK
jgi:hypothetical protein